jgi:hypothetical protein
MKRQSCDMPTVQAIEGDEDIKSSGAGIVQSGQTAGLAETATGTVWSGEPAPQSTSGRPVTGAKMFTAALARVTMWDGDEQRAEALALCLAHEARRFSDSQDCWFMTPAVGEPTPEKWLLYHQLHPLALGAAMRCESDNRSAHLIANVMTYKAVVWPKGDCSPIADAEADRQRHMQAIATEAMLALYDGDAEKARSVGALAARDFIESVDLIDPALIPRGAPLHGAVMSC